jgi:REP element-mobilizing transposase RayT
MKVNKLINIPNNDLKMNRFKNRYRNSSARAYFWDYSWKATYFVTICTHDRIHWFGDIVNWQMNLSKIGQIVKSEWLKTFEMRPDMNLSMGEYVVMPNHFHAIIGIGKNKYNSKRNTVDDNENGIEYRCRDAMHCVPTTDNDNNKSTKQPKNKFGPQSKNLASIIRGFKIGVTKNACLIHPDFKWQPRFYDHIIRDDKSFQRISNYIINNPVQWQKDTFFRRD